MLDTEKVSVLLATYQCNTLAVAVKSILEQTYRNLELVIVNDGGISVSTIIKEFNDERIKLIELKENYGLAKALNIGLNYCTGQYIARMDADDFSLPFRIYAQLKHIKDNDLDLIGGWTIDFDQRKYTMNTPVTSHNDIVQKLRFSVPIFHPCFFGKASIFYEIRYNEKLKFSQDYDFVVRCALADKRLGNTPIFCVIYNTNDKPNLVKEVKQIAISNHISAEYVTHLKGARDYKLTRVNECISYTVPKVSKILYLIKVYLRAEGHIRISKLMSVIFLLSFNHGRIFLLRNLKRKYFL